MINICWIQTWPQESLPQEVFFHTPDREHAADITSCADELDAKVRSFLNDLVAIVSVLGRCGIRVPSDVGRNELGRLAGVS